MKKIYISKSLDPCINLAWEEMLHNQTTIDDQILYLWQNEKTVVIGQNQNPWKECNLELLNQIGGTLVRRKSGGGAVYHDHGNLNFTFLSAYHQDTVVNNLELILKALESYGIDATFKGRNDLVVGEVKISGNAYYLKGDIICHHGTLLVDVDFDLLSKVLTPSIKKLESKGVNSIRSRVSNLKLLNPSVSIDGLIERLSHIFWGGDDWPTAVILLEQPDAKLIPDIERYRSWKWNYGQSPNFDLEYHKRYSWGEVMLEIEVVDGYIKDLRVYTDAIDVSLAQIIQNELLDQIFNDKVIDNIITGIGGV